MKTLRKHRQLLGWFMTCLMALWLPGQHLHADVLYKQNTGANSTLDTATFTPAAPGAILQNYAEGTAFTAADTIAFNNAITGATTFRVSGTTGTNLQVGGLVVGTPFLGSILNPGGGITIQNGAGAAGSPVANTLTLGASGIDMLFATQNLTISSDTTNGSSLGIATNSNQTWKVGNGRTLTLAAGTTLSNNITIQGNGTTTITGAISGAGNITLEGNALGGSVLTLGGNNSAWTGSLTVSGNSLVNIDNFVTAGQHRLNTASTLTLNRGRVDLTNNASAQTQAVAALALGQGLNTLTRTSTNAAAKLEINNATITRGTGAAFAVNGASLGTTATPTTAANSPLIVDTLNTNGILGTWAVNINGATDTNWLVNGPNTANGGVVISSAVYTTNNAVDTWTTATQNILVNAATTASTASRTINSLKILPTVAGAITVDIGAANTLTINDGQNGGGIIRVGNNTTQIGTATPGQGFLTAGGVDDSVNDTLYLYNSQSTMTINNVIKNNNTGVGTDTLHLFLGGAGSVTLNAANTFTGGITIAAGQLNLGNNNVNGNAASLGSGDIVNHGTLLYDKTAAATVPEQTISNNISSVGAFTVNRSTAILSGNNTFQGLTTIAANAILKAGSATGLSPHSRIILNTAGTGTLDLNGFNVSVAALRGDQTTNRVLLGANTLTITGSDLSSNTGTAGSLQSLVGQNYQGTIEGTGNLVKEGAMSQIFTAGGALSYTGTTTVNGGILQTNKAMATSGVTVNNVATALGGNATFISNIANSLTATTSVNLAAAGSTWQINNGFSQSIGSLSGVADARINIGRGATATNLTVSDSGGAPVTFAGVIQETGTGINGASFTKDGTNTLIFTGGNNYSGATTVNGGTLRIGLANAVQVIPDRSSVSIGAAGILDLNGNNETVGSLAGVAGGQLLMGAGSLTTGLDNASTDFAGAITGSGGLNKVGTGTQTLSGGSTFTGAITISNLGGQTGGGLTIGTGGSLADTVAIANRGYNTTLTFNANDTVGPITGTNNTIVAIGTGATVTSSYTNGTATALAATADSASANGRIVRNIITSGLKAGDLISGTGVSAGSYITQIIDADTVLVNLNVPTGPTNDFVPTVTALSVLDSAVTGLGGFTKDGAGTLILTGNSSHSGATTINAGDVQIGGIWNAQKFALHDTLSDASQIVFAGTGTQNLNFASSTTNLQSFERIGSVAGGAGTTTSINLFSGANIATLAIGGDNSTSTFTGRFLGNSGATLLIKEGTGNFTWSNPTTDVFDGPVFVDNGTFTIAGAQGFDASNEVYMTNRGATLGVSTTGGDAIPFLQGGKGDARIILGSGTQPVGGLTSNYLTTVAPTVTLTTNLTVNENTAPSLATLAGVYTFNGDIGGAATLIKSGNHLWRLMGTSTNAHTGETQITGGTLQTGILSRSAGVGAVAGTNIFGTLSSATGLRLTGGVLDINGTSQTVTRINASSTGGTIQLVNGSLTLSNQNTQTTGTVFTSNLNGVLNLNATAASTLSLTGNSTNFGGTINVGTNAALTLNRAGGALNSTGIPAARINLGGTGTQLTVTLADTIGSLAGSGNAVLTQNLTIREGYSGTVSATGYSGNTSGAGALILSNFGGLTLSGSNAHTGGTTLSSNSSLNLNYGTGIDILPGSGALTLNGGRIAVYNTSLTPSILESVGSTSLNAGASSIETWSTFNAVTAIRQGNGNGGIGLGAITRAAGGTINVVANAASTSTANVNGILGGYATFDGRTWAVANSAGTAISGLGAFSADTFGAGLHVDITVAGPNAGGSADTLRFSGANASDINGATTIATGGILVSPSVYANSSTISGALDATGNELVIHQYNPLGDLILSNVAGTNTAITTAGGGRTVITNDIAGTGNTTVGYGYLQLGNGGATGMIGTGTVLNNGTLGVNRNSAVTLGAVISGTGNIEQLGSGTTTLSAANTFAGRTTVRGGTLEITNNAGLGLAATSPTNRWANLTSVNSGGTLLVNVTAGGTITETLNLDGGTLDLRSTAATTLAAPIILNSDSTIHVSNPGAAVTHLITGEIYALPGSDLTITNVGGATPSTVALAPAAVAGSRWEGTTISVGGRLQIGNNSRGFIGTGNVTNNGELIMNINDGHYVLGNTISGSGNFTTTRNTVYLTADNTYTGTTIVGRQAENAGVSLRIGNDTYSGMHGTGDITLQAVTGGASDLRYHLIADTNVANNITMNANSDGTTARNATIFRQGIGNISLNGNLAIGATNLPAPGTQRAVLQTEGGGILSFNGTLVGGSANNVLNIVNNGIFRFGGTASNSYHGVLSGNNVWVFDNSGTTTLLGVNTFNTGSTYLRRGTVAIGTGGVDTIQNDNDMHVLAGATLSVLGNETIGQLYMQRGGVTTIATGTTLTVDDAGAQLVAGSIQGLGSLTLAGGTYMAMYGTNTATGTLTIAQGAIQTANFANAIGSFTGSVVLGSAALNGGLEYIGSGETFAKNITLAGTGSNYIAANGSGALILSGNLTATGATSTLRLIGQTGGYFNPITNQVTGIISDGANVLSIAMPNSGDDDRFGISGRWALTNASNDFSGGITVNVGMMEFTQLGTGTDATSSMGNQATARTITLGSNNFNGRRYDMFGSGDQLGDAGFSQGTNTLTPAGDVGTIIFNDSTAGTANLSNFTWAMPNVTTTNTSGMQIINNGVKQVNLFNAFSFGTTGNRVVVLDGSNTLSNTINGAIGNPTTSQSTSVTKEGAGTWRLAGTNTYTGTTAINNGILEITGGAAIADSATIAINGDGGDGLFSGVAKLRVLQSESIGLLSGDVLTEAEIVSGQILTITGGNSTMNGLITGDGGLTRTIPSGATGGTLTTSAKNTYLGVTTLGSQGTATANAGISITHLANGGAASGLGASSNAATNLVFTTNTAGTNGGILTWTGLTNQSTDRLFTMGLGTAGARINATGTVVGTTAPTMTWSNTGALGMTGAGARTLTLGGTTSSVNVFRPAITDGGGLTSLSKVDAGFWLLDPAAAANTFTGGTTITGGTLAIQAGDALGTGLITINGGGGVGLQIRGGITLANNITNSTAEGGIQSFTGNNILSGTVTSNINFRAQVDGGSSVELNNGVSSWAGTGQMIKLGNGTMIMSGVNTNTAATFVRDGILELNYAINNTSKLADAAGLTLGGITIHTVVGLDANVGGVSLQTGQSGGRVHLNGGSHLEVVSATTLEPGSSAITRAGGSTAVLRLNGITRANSGGTIDFGAASIADTDTSNVNGILGSYATVAKTDWAASATTAADTAITALAAYNVDTYGANNNVDVTTYAGVGTAANTLRFNNGAGGTLTLGGTFAMTGGGLLVTPNVNAGNVVITGGAIQNAANTAGLEGLIIHQHSTTNVLEINSVIQNNTNAQALTKTGAGKLILSGLNTFTGNVNLFEGEIQVGGTAAAPNVATNAFLSGLLATPAANAAAGWQLAEGTTLRFLTTNTTFYNTPAFNGEGKIIMDVGNQGVLLFDDDNGNWIGDFDFFGGTVRGGANNNALGSVRGVLNVANSVNFIFTGGQTFNKVTNYADGTTFNIQNNTATSAGAFSGKQNFNNTTTAGLNFNVDAPTTAGTVSLNINGIIYGSNGFTKSGNGILQLSANNFTDVYDGYTGINDTPSLSGQIAVNAGVLYVGGARALGAHGAGNEVIVASGASLDLRGQALNYGDDSDATRKIIQISGNGFVNAQGNATGALRNTAGTGQVSHLTLNANSVINTGGFVNASAFVIGTFDTNLSNANGLSGAFTRNAPVIAGGGFDLTVQGGRLATDNFVIADPSFSTALNRLVIAEGGSRLRHEVSANISGAAGVGITSTNITNGIHIAYAGLTAADLTGATAGGQGNTTSVLGANVGARLLLENWYGTHHTFGLTMDGATAAAATGTPGGARSLAGGINVLQSDFFTIPDGTTYLDGTLGLTGTANRNLIISDSIGNYSVVEQGNTTVAPVTKLVFGGVASGTGGFSKIGFAEARFTANNTFSGDVNVLRFGTSSSPWQSSTVRINGVDYATNGLGEGWAEWGLTLNGASGAFSNVTNINLQRRGMITLDNTTRLAPTSGVAGGNNNDRINDAAVTNMSNGWLRINGGTVSNTETLGTVNISSASNIVDLYPTDGAGTNMTLTIGTLNRAAGGTVRFVNLDPTSTFSTASAGESVRVAVTTLNPAQLGAGGAANTTTRSIVQGVFGGNVPLGLDTDFRMLGFNNGNVTDLWNQQRNLQFLAGSHFMTYEGGFLRPLDDDEYFTPTDGILSSAITVNQNVNLSDVITQVKNNTTINSLRFGALQDHDGSGGTINAGTTLTNEVQHHAISLQVDGTLTITSGMISSAYWTSGNTSNSGTLIYGGVLDFNGQEAIINNQNGYFNTTAGVISGGGFEIRTPITNATGLTKTGSQQIVLDAANTYTGLTTISEGTIFLRHGRSALGVGGTGNGIVITGSGNLNTGSGIVVGTAAAREDILIGVLSGDQQIMRVDNDVTVWNSNVTIDNVDASGMTLFTPRIRADNSATSIINGHIAGGDTLISNDILQTDSRVVQFDSTGNNVFIMRGQFGDRYVAGVAAPIADPISALPTLAGTRTNENEVLRVTLAGGNDETNLILDRNYNAAGRLTIARGTIIANYDPAALDGSGFWTADAISKIPNADSTTTAFSVNGGTAHQGFVLGTGGNTYAAIFLSRANQVFNMASWTMAGTGAKFIGGLNQSGTVTFGNGTGSLTAAGAVPNLYAMDGGTVVFDQRLTGNVGTAPGAFAFLKAGRGQVTLQNTALAVASDASFVLGGGTLLLNHTGTTVQALVGNLNARFDGGTLVATASSGAATTTAFATNDAADRVLNFSIGGTEIVARTTNTGTARNMTINMGNANANGTTPGTNFTRGLGATANLVEDSAAGGVAQITLNFNATTTAAVKNQVIPWATHGTLSRTANDFAMVDGGLGNDVRSYTRALDEYNNNVASWNANGDISENGGAGFSGTLGAPLTLSTLRFDANADSTVNLGTNVLTVAGNGLASSGGGILVSSNVGSANKTITGGIGAGLTTSGGRVELILHHYGTGNLNVNVPVTGAGVDLVIAGPSTTNAATIGTTGAVVLGATNTYDGQTFINGSVLSFSNPNQLGTNATGTAIVMNGGTLRYTGTGLSSLGSKGIQFDGNGGTIDVQNGGSELMVTAAIASNATYRGDLVKVGAGTLTLQGTTNVNFNGLTDIRQGTLRLTNPNRDAGTTTNTVLGSNNSYMDGTIFRTGTNLAIQFGNLNDTGEWNVDEWFTFEGNNYVSIGTINTQTVNIATSGFPDPNNERPVNFNGVNTINGAVTFDVVPNQTFRLNNGAGYTTGTGTITKDGQGTMVMNTNNPDYTGSIVIKQGRLTGVGQADIFGTGYNSGATITLGANDRQGIAELTLTSESIHGHTLEINHNINVVYNPAQSKRLLLETFANGSNINVNSNITLNDNLQVYINDGAEVGGSQNYVNFNGQLLDGTTTSGNLVITGDDTGNANDNTSGRPYNYLVLKGNNSGWTGDVRVNTNTSYDQDQTAILRLENNNALTAANDVDMGFNSILQAGGGARTIGALSTNGGTGPFIGGVAGGTMGASTNGTTVIIENAATTAGTLTITQTTPASTEVLWNAHFRDGTLNSQFYAPGSGPTASAALNVVKAGDGWATLTTDNAYTGTTTVTGGILQVGRGGVGDTGASNASGLTANLGTTIAGTGQIHGSSTIYGNLKPGDEAGGSMGTLVFTSATTLGVASVSTLQIQRASYTAMNALGYDNATNYGAWIAGITSDPTYSHLLNDPVTTSQHDKIIVSSTITSGGKIVISNNGYNPTHGDVFNLLDWVGAALSFNVGGTPFNGGLLRTGAESGLDLELFELGGGYRWDVSLFNTDGIVVVVVPEPSRALLILLGLLGLMMRRRRKAL